MDLHVSSSDPYSSSSSIDKNLIQSARDYLNYATIYETELNLDKLQCFIRSFNDVFIKDELYEWVLMTLNHLPKNLMKRLSHIYQVLSLQDLTKFIGWNNDNDDDTHSKVEIELNRLIEKGSILASIDSEHQLVTFHDHHPTSSSNHYEHFFFHHYKQDVEFLEKELYHVRNHTKSILFQLHSHPNYLEKLKHSSKTETFKLQKKKEEEEDMHDEDEEDKNENDDDEINAIEEG